jgi:nucleoside recognition membrane protein YjiH
MHRDFSLYRRQGVRILCSEDRKNEQSDMTWVKRIIIFLLVGFFLFYLVSEPEAAANAVRGVFHGLALVFRSILIFFQTLAG